MSYVITIILTNPPERAHISISVSLSSTQWTHIKTGNNLNVFMNNFDVEPIDIILVTYMCFNKGALAEYK